jgi:hypothetical protein
MAFSVNDNGTWKTVKKLSVNDGAWKAVKSGWINKDGIWTKFYSGSTTINVSSQNNINLRTLYTDQTGDSSSDAVSVTFNINGNIGSTSPATAAMVTGTWPAGSEIIVNVGTGVYVVGAGGRYQRPPTFGSQTGSGFCRGVIGQAGGNAIELNYSGITIVNNGTIGGGGGCGGMTNAYNDYNLSFRWDDQGYVPGGGAGLVNGNYSPTRAGVALATLTTGGAGQTMSYYYYDGNNYTDLLNYSGKGGDLGQPGAGALHTRSGSAGSTSCPAGAGGSAGSAIVRNGYTYTLVGNALLGAVS